MVLERWAKRRERRRTKRGKHERDVRERAFAVLRAVAEPLVRKGLARLDWIDAVPSRALGPAARLVPARADAAAVELYPNAWSVVLQLGPDPRTCKLDVDRSGLGWEEELRRILEAVVHGRFTQVTEPWRHGFALTLTFEQPDAEDIVVIAHYATGRDDTQARRERAFASYA